MNDEVTIILNNKDVIKIKKNTSIRDVIKSNEDYFDKSIIGVKVNNDIVSYDYKITKDISLNTFNANDIDGYKMFQAGLKFVMIVALKELFGHDVDVIFDHSIARGIHATIINKDEFNEDDAIKLSNKMKEIINEDKQFVKLVVDVKEAYNYYEKVGYKEKALNIHNISNQIINLYRLDNYLNYS